MENKKNMENKKFYPVFSVDVCFASYAIEYKLIGAKNVKDLRQHIKAIVSDYGLSEEELSVLETGGKRDAYRIVKMKNVYTDKPYQILDSFSYYE